jgi:hypothetical protein
MQHEAGVDVAARQRLSCTSPVASISSSCTCGCARGTRAPMRQQAKPTVETKAMRRRPIRRRRGARPAPAGLRARQQFARLRQQRRAGGS